MAEETKLMSVKEVAEFLGISRKSVYRLVATGELRGFKVGGVLRFRQVDISRMKLPAPKAFGVGIPKRDHSGLLHSGDAYLEQTGTKLRRPYPGRVFSFYLLARYYVAPRKYQIIKRGRFCWFSLAEPYLKGLAPADRAREEFKPVKYRKVRSPKGENVIVVSPGYFNRLAPALQKEWLRFEVKPRQ